MSPSGFVMFEGNTKGDEGFETFSSEILVMLENQIQVMFDISVSIFIFHAIHLVNTYHQQESLSLEEQPFGAVLEKLGFLAARLKGSRVDTNLQK